MFYPQFTRKNEEYTNNGGFTELQGYLNNQKKLMKQYNALWRQDEIQENIRQQEKNILENLQLISKNLGEVQGGIRPG